MQYKSGYCWKAVYDEDRNLYTAGFFDPVTGSCKLFEIDKTIFERLEDGMDNSATSIFSIGRNLYAHINDQYGSPFTIVFDEAYKELCPWALVPEPEPKETWPKKMTDAVVKALDSEKDKTAEG